MTSDEISGQSFHAVKAMLEDLGELDEHYFRDETGAETIVINNQAITKGAEL